MTGQPRILVILPNNYGDVIMATPVLEGLRERYCDSSIVFFVEEGFDAGLQGNPHCSGIVCFNRRDVRQALESGNGRDGLDALRGIVGSLNQGRFDAVINLAQHSYVSHLAGCIETKQWHGQRFLHAGNHSLGDGWSRYLYAIPFARRFNNLHVTDVYRRICGVQAHGGRNTIVFTKQETGATAEFLHDQGVVCGDKTVLMQPGSAYPSKRWPAENFIMLGVLLARAGWRIIVSGAPYDHDLAQQIVRGIGPSCIDCSGMLTLRQSMALCSQVQAVVSGDTAMMHAAAAVPVPVFALFGPTSPIETGPYGNGHVIFSGGCDKRPCFKKECASHQCMRSIQPQTIFDCIEHKTVPLQDGCSIYKTVLQPSGDYSMAACIGPAFDWFEASGSALTRVLLGEQPMVAEFTKEELAPHLQELRLVESVCGEMVGALNSFMATREKKYIRLFEGVKEKLGLFSGIGAFAGALINLQINSIPLLNVPAGVVAYRQALCSFSTTLRAIIDQV